jgi:hypothetical protein
MVSSILVLALQRYLSSRTNVRDLFGLKLIRFLLVPRRNDIELFNQFTDIRNQNGILLNIVVGLDIKLATIFQLSKNGRLC